MPGEALEGKAKYTVSMPQMSDDVEYSINFVQLPPSMPDLCECDYLIEWSPKGKDNVRCFAAQAGGNHFRYGGGNRLQEYHFIADSVPFLAGQGVQRTAQFVDLLPAMVCSRLKAMEADSACILNWHTDTVVGGRKCMAVDVISRVRGIVARESEFVLDKKTLLPLTIVHENNPGQVSEQTVRIEYTDIHKSDVGKIDEELLMERFGDVFADCRQSNFRIDRLKGKRLPSINLPTTTGERYMRTEGDRFRAPTVIVMMESGAGFNKELVQQVREGIDALPRAADVVWVFADSHVDMIEETIGSVREGEHALMSGRGFLRDCGASNLPSILICSSDSRVSSVKIGYNNDVAEFVIQNITLFK